MNNAAPSKSLIFLKSSVIALGLVFIVLLTTLIVVKGKKDQKKITSCKEFLNQKLTDEIAELKIGDKNIIILTKKNSKTNQQEILTLSNNCAKIINHYQFEIEKN